MNGNSHIEIEKGSSTSNSRANAEGKVQQERMAVSGLALGTRWNFADTLQFAALVVVAGFWCWWIGWRNAQPHEDAAMLFRYVDNVAAGNGVVWNVGDSPTDGATDLGFMFALAGMRRVGIDAQTGCLILNTLAFVGIAGGLFVFARLRNVPPLPAIMLAALFIVSPAAALIDAGFGAVFFSASVGLATLAMFRLTDAPNTRNAVLMASAGILAGLIRPEGFLIAVILTATAAVVAGRPGAKPTLVTLSTLLVASAGFVLARWAYFGFPLPNPYYKKGGGSFHIDGLIESVKFALTVGAMPILLLILVGMLGSVNRRWFAYVIGLALQLGMWTLLSSEMNYLFRFQLPALVVALFMVADLGSRARPVLADRVDMAPTAVRRLGPAVAAAAVAAQLLTQHVLGSSDSDTVPQRTIAKILSGSAEHGLLVATTEAGYVCWQSGWECVDLWGLNDKAIAHAGYLDEAALAHLRPDVIVIHAPTSPTATSIHADAAGFLSGWPEMTDPLIRFAESGDYELSAILRPKASSGFAVYVRRGENWSDRLISAFEAVKPTIANFYGTAAGLRPALPTNG